jgi:hypothetical protein
MGGNMELILTVELIAGLLFLVVVGLSRIEHELIQRSHRSLLVDPEREQRSGDAIAAWNGGVYGAPKDFAISKLPQLIEREPLPERISGDSHRAR